MRTLKDADAVVTNTKMTRAREGCELAGILIVAHSPAARKRAAMHALPSSQCGERDI